MDDNFRTSPWVLALASVASLMVALDTLVVSAALGTIRLDLDASIEELEWTVNSYNLTLAVLLMTAAALGDRLGRRRMFAAGLALFVVASAACALAPGVGWLIAARAVQGAGAALVLPLALTLVSAAYAPERRAQAIGFLEGITGVAVVAGPVLGGAITDGLAWEWIFWVNVPIGLLAIPFVLTKIDESRGEDTALDVRGLALVTGGAVGIVWALVRGNTEGWGSPEVVASLAAGVVLTVAFVAWELRAPQPMLPMRFFRSRAFSAGNAATFFMLASLFGCVFFLPQFLQTSLGHDPLGAGLRLVPWTATLFIVAPIAGSLVTRFGERPFTVIGLGLQAVGMGWLALIAEPGVAYGAMVAPLIIAGVGISMAIPATQNAVIGAVAPSAVGKAAGTNSMVRELGGVFGIAIAVAVFAAAGSYASPVEFGDGFGVAVGISAGLSLMGAIAGLAMSGRERRPAAGVVASTRPAFEEAG